MQATASRQSGGQGRGGSGMKPNFAALRRAIGYLGNQRRPAMIAYGALIFATIAQLAVPQLVQNMLEAVTNGTIANTVLDRAPAAFLPMISERLNLTVDQLRANSANAESLLVNAVLLVIAFAVCLPLFRLICQNESLRALLLTFVIRYLRRFRGSPLVTTTRTRPGS